MGPHRHATAFAQVVLATDAVVLIVSFLLAYVIRDRMLGYGELYPLGQYTWLLGFVLPTWLVLARVQGLTEAHGYRTLQGAIFLTVRAHAIGALLLLSALYLLRAVEVSRLLMQTYLIVALGALVTERAVIRQALERRGRRTGQDVHRILIVGATSAATTLLQRLRESPDWSAQVVGVAASAPGAVAGWRSDAPILGSVADVPALLDTMVFDEVVLADERLDQTAVEALVEACLTRGVTYRSLVRMPVAPFARHHAEALGNGLYLMSLETAPQNLLHLAIKRAIDVAGGFIGLAVCGLTGVVVAPLIGLTSPGPIIFRQTRVGRNGRLFTLYKFRTMCDDAESRKLELVGGNQMCGPLFKLRNDPRVTRVGRLLRRAYIDELPQFWNVLKGDMSLVGTRPPTLDEVARYAPGHRRRLSVRPGITGLWQCEGNGRIADFGRVVGLDCEYIDRWSLWLDVKILLRTCWTVARFTGQ